MIDRFGLCVSMLVHFVYLLMVWLVVGSEVGWSVLDCIGSCIQAILR